MEAGMSKFLNFIFFTTIRLVEGIKNRISGTMLYSTASSYMDYNFLKYHGVDTEFGSVKLIGFPIIKKARNSQIIIGKGVTLVSHSKGNRAGINHPVILATMEGAKIIIGNGCGFSGSAICSASSIEIGDFSGFGANASAYDTDFHSIEHFGTSLDGVAAAATKPIRIGRYVWVGANALILKGVAIEDHCVVGAGAIVRKNIYAGTSV